MQEITRKVNNGVVEETVKLSREEINQRIYGIERRISSYNESIIRAGEEKAEYEQLLSDLEEQNGGDDD